MGLQSSVVIPRASCSTLSLCPHSVLSFRFLTIATEWFSVVKLWLRNVKHNDNFVSADHCSSKGPQLPSIHRFSKFINKPLKWMQFLGFYLWVAFFSVFHLFTTLQLYHINVTKSMQRISCMSVWQMIQVKKVNFNL